MSPPEPGDRIEVRGLRVTGTHGVLPQERDHPQPFEIDLDVWLDTTDAARSDELADTVDYAELSERAAGMVSGPHHFQLLEALADAVAGVVLGADTRISAVAASVRKLEPPLPLDLDSIGVRVLRHRKGGPRVGGAR